MNTVTFNEFADASLASLLDQAFIAPAFTEPTSSQPVSQQESQPVYPYIRKKNHAELEWLFLSTMDEDECYYLMSRSQYKMTGSHNGYIWRCTVHANVDDHKMEISYYRCSSKNCIRESGDICSYRNCFYLYSLKTSTRINMRTMTIQ